MLDLIPAQQPIKNQHQLLWCGYQHVITSKPITTLVFMRRPAFSALGVNALARTKRDGKDVRFWCEYSHQRRTFFCCGNSAADISKSHTFKLGPIQTKDARFFCCGNSAADISKPHTFKWGTLADDVFPSANFTLLPKPRPPTGPI